MDAYISDKLTLYCGNRWLNFHTTIWRIAFPDRVIFETDMPIGKDNLCLLDNADSVVLKYIECGRFDDISNGVEVLILKNLRLRRKWMPRPMLLTYNNKICTIFTEYTCEIEEKWMR